MKRIIPKILVLILAGCASVPLNSGKFYLISASERIQVHFAKDLIVIPAAVNSIEGRFIFDNGASTSVFNPVFLKKTGITFTDSSSVTDANTKSRKIPYGIVNQLTIGPVRFKNTRAYEVDLSPLFPCDSIDGIIGANIINRLVWEINPRDSSITVQSSTRNLSGTSIPLKYSRNNSAIMSVGVDGIILKTKIDLGSRWALKLKSDDLPRTMANKGTVVVGSTSQSAFGLAELDTVVELKKPTTITTAGTPIPNSVLIRTTNRQNYPAYLGMGFFKQFHFTFDGPGKKIYLHNRLSEQKPLAMGYGLRIYPKDGQWQVIEKELGFPEVANICLGTEVVKIDDREVREFSDLCKWETYYKGKVANREVLKIQFATDPTPILLPYR